MKTNLLKYWITGLLLPLFASCGGGNGTETDTPEPDEPAGKAVHVTYTVADPGDMLTVFGIAFEYNNEKGETVREAFTASPWTKTLSNFALPFRAALKITFTPRENIPEKVYYRLGEGVTLRVYQEGEQDGGYSHTSAPVTNIGFARLDEGIVLFGKELTYVLNIDREGGALKVVAE
jgi:hypothetical protein